ncbi:MAG: RNA-guided pseudouridylation complex pseudouridine synthase subunit Cbf5 [Thermocladium sp.]
MVNIEKCDTERGIHIKIDEGTSDEYGVYPEKRSIEDHVRRGFIVLDKPRGPSSHEVVSWIKRMLNLERAGHAGTLDPRVSGVLPVALGDSTKVLQGISHESKEYIAVMMLHGDADDNTVKSVLREFIGEIYQRPPVKSAVKRQLRTRHVYSLEMLERDGRYILLDTNVEAGTYVRKLCYDIGEVLRVGANMRELRRIRVGCFKEDEAITLHDLADAIYLWRHYGDETLMRKLIKPVEYMVKHLPRIFIRDSAVDSIAHGAALAAPGVAKVEDGVERDRMVAIVTLKGELVALGKAAVSTSELLSMNKGIVAKPTRVIMERGVYPSAWPKGKDQDARGTSRSTERRRE